MSSSLPPEEQLARLVFGKVASMALSVAAKLRIADRLAEAPQTAAELAAATQTHPPTLYRLMRALVSVGVFRTDDDGRFHLTPVGDLLRTGVKGSMRGMADFMGAEWSWKAWGQLLHSVRTGRTAFDDVFGEPCFDYLAKHPDDSAVFNEGMVGFSSGIAEAVVDAYDFAAFGTVTDVGGGHGGLLLAILKATPTLRGVVFDAPHVVAGAAEAIRAAGLTDRCTTVGGDFFQSVPSGADAYLMKHIVHDWNDDNAAKILRNLRSAARPGAKLLLVEAVIPPGDEPHLGKLLDLEMLVVASGRERTEAEYRDLLMSCGFRLGRVVSTRSPVDVLEAEAV